MSGTMMPPMGGGMAPQGMPQQMPPQMGQQMPQRGAPAPMPQMPSGQPNPQAMGGMAPPIQPPVVGGAAANNPNLALFAQAAQGAGPQGAQPMGAQMGPHPGGAPGMGGAGQQRLTPAEMAKLGRFGDKVLAHLSPGEIAVPQEAQTPQVMGALKQAFGQFGVGPEQFTAGSPYSAHNPATGAPEYSILGALLPVLGAVGGSFIPGLGTGLGMALGGGLGGLAGGAIDHTGPLGMLAGAAGGAAGGYLGGSGGLSGLFGGSGAATDTTALAGAAGEGTANPFGVGPLTNPAGVTPMGAVGGDMPMDSVGSSANGVIGQAANPGMGWGQRLMGGLYAGTGASLGASLAPQSSSTSSGLPPGFNNPVDPLNPNYGGLLGSHQSATPSFAGYNPYTSVMGPNPGYRFYPVS